MVTEIVLGIPLNWIARHLKWQPSNNYRKVRQNEKNLK